MEVVLKQDVDSLGLRGDVVNVARGYARNFLLPRGLAETATPGLKRELERRDAQRARHEAKTVDEARAIASRLEASNLRFDVTAGPTGALFGSVTATNVADRLWEQEKVRVDRRKLADGHDQAHRALHGGARGLPRRGRGAEARRRPGRPGAADGRGARGAGGCRGRGQGGAEPAQAAEPGASEPSRAEAEAHAEAAQRSPTSRTRTSRRRASRSQPGAEPDSEPAE